MTPSKHNAAHPATRMRVARTGSRAVQAGNVQRERILAAIVRVLSEHGLQSTTVARVLQHAGVSRRTFYELFQDRDDCLLAAIEEATAIAARRAAAAYATHARWADRVRAALLALLEFADDEPELAELCVVHALAAGPTVLKRRRELLDSLARAVDEGGRSACTSTQVPPPVVAEGLVGGVLGVIHTRLVGPSRDPLVALSSPLTGMIMLPYLGRRAAVREFARSPPTRSPAPPKTAIAPDLLKRLDMRMTYRTMTVLAVIAAQPGLSNAEVSQRAGITDQGQISRLLTRLTQLGLTQNSGVGQPRGGANAWRLTAKGADVECAMRVHMRIDGRTT
jgi:AcrR family transcriptional regulator